MAIHINFATVGATSIHESKQARPINGNQVVVDHTTVLIDGSDSAATIGISSTIAGNFDDNELPSADRLSISGSGKHQQSMNNAEARSNESKDLSILLVDEQIFGAVPNAASPTLHISNPDLAKMVKDAQTLMFINTTPKIMAPWVTLNTSVQDVRSQSMESFCDRDDNFGQQLLSTGNNQ